MPDFSFPEPSELSCELVQFILEEYECREFIKKKEHENIAALLLVLLALLPGLRFKEYREVLRTVPMKEKEYKPIFNLLKEKGVLELEAHRWRVVRPPSYSRLAEWLNTAPFAPFRQQVAEWEKTLLDSQYTSVFFDRWGQPHYSLNSRLLPQAPEGVKPYDVCRLLRVLGKHESAYAILKQNAGSLYRLMEDSRFTYASWHRLEVLVHYYSLLGNKYEPSLTQPKSMQVMCLRDNILCGSLCKLREDEFFADKQRILGICENENDEELLFTIIFQCLQQGQWEPIQKIAARSHLPSASGLATKLCNWVLQKKWSCLRGMLRLVADYGYSGVMFMPFFAMVHAVNKVSYRSLESIIRYGDIRCHGKALLSMQIGLRALMNCSCNVWDGEYLYTSPVGLFCILLLPLLEGGEVELQTKQVERAAEACIAWHQRGMTLYSWYMASILMGYGGIMPEMRTQLQAIIESRSDLVPIPGLKPFMSRDALILDKFLNFTQEVAAGKDTNSKKNNGRIEWNICLNKNGTLREIEPVFCKLNRKGTWTDGRKAGMEALKEGKYSDILIPEDQLVLNELHWRYSWDGETFEFSDKAIEHLCGHPHLRVTPSGEAVERDVSLELLPPRLQIKKCEGGVRLTLPKEDYADIRLERLDERRYGLCIPSDATDKLSRLIEKFGEGNTLLLADKEGEKVASALASLTHAFRLTGDVHVAAGNMPEVESASRLVACLKRESGVLSGTLGIECFAEATLVIPGKGEGELMMMRAAEQVLVKRDLVLEKKRMSALLKACPTLAACLSMSHTWKTTDFEESYAVLCELHDFGSENVELRWPEGEPLALQTIRATSFKLTVGEGADHWLNIGGDVQVDEHCVLKFTKFLELVQQREGAYIRMDDTHILRLSQSILKQADMLSMLMPLASAGGRVRKHLQLPPAAMALLAMNRKTGELPAALERPVNKVWDALQANRNTKLPASLRANLRDYQITGYQWMMQLVSAGMGACLADDMGLGKTLQVLTLLLAKAAEGPSLVVAPASVCSNWVREAARFTPVLRMVQLRQYGREEVLETLGERDVLVCSYGLLVREAESLCKIGWNVVALDEAQSIKNSQSRRAEYARNLNARYRIAATGTPLENNLLELWSLMEFLNPGYLGARSSFLSRFKDVPQRLRMLISPFVLRRLKGEVLDELPEKNEQVHYVELSDTERSLYEALRRKAVLEMKESPDRFRMLAYLTRLRRFCCHPELGTPECGLKSSAKMEALRELAYELRAGGHRALIFSQFTDVLAYARHMCEEEGFTYLYLDGSTPTATRGHLVDSFQRGEADFFLISLKAGGVGLNLTAADFVVLMDPWWNPASEDQAADRVHRIGQDKAVTVCRLVCTDTIEQRVLELHSRKREMVDSVLSSDASANADALSVEELLKLMQ